MALVGVLACIGSVTPTEPPQGPWQALNPAVATPEKAKPQREEVMLTPEEEFLVNNIPFKLPFKMDRKQTAVAMKLMKEAVKPIIKSKTLHETVSYVDDLLHFLVDDIETQMYMNFFLDFMQDIYEGKEREQVDKIVKSFIYDNSDEVREAQHQVKEGGTGAQTDIYIDRQVYRQLRKQVNTLVRSFVHFNSDQGNKIRTKIIR